MGVLKVRILPVVDGAATNQRRSAAHSERGEWMGRVLYAVVGVAAMSTLWR